MTTTSPAQVSFADVSGMVPRYMRSRHAEAMRLAAQPAPPPPPAAVFRFELGRVDKSTPELRQRIQAASTWSVMLGELRKPLAGLIGVLTVAVPALVIFTR